jgi:hypothetical protein
VQDKKVTESDRFWYVGFWYCKLRNPARASKGIVDRLAKPFHAEHAIILRNDRTHRIITAVVAQQPFSQANLLLTIILTDR